MANVMMRPADWSHDGHAVDPELAPSARVHVEVTAVRRTDIRVDGRLAKTLGRSEPADRKINQQSFKVTNKNSLLKG